MAKEPSTQPTPFRRAPSIKIAFQTLGRTLRHGYENLGTIALISIFWYIGLLLVLPLGVVTAALHRVTKPMTEERAANWRSFFEHIRADLRWSSALLTVLVIGMVVLQSNTAFYNDSPAAALRAVAIIFLTMLIIWSGIMLFAFPIALRQQEYRLRTTLRNALIMTMANAPGVMVSLVLLTLLVVALLIVPPLFIFVPGIVALWSEENARLLLVASGYVQRDEFADRTPTERMRR